MASAAGAWPSEKPSARRCRAQRSNYCTSGSAWAKWSAIVYTACEVRASTTRYFAVRLARNIRRASPDLEVARTGMRVNRQHKDVNRARQVHSLFRIEEY